MTLIIKELVIRGVVKEDTSLKDNGTMDKEALSKYLAQMKKEMVKECTETILSKLESNRNR